MSAIDGKKMKMPHPGHEEHLCYLENIGYLRSPKLLEVGVDWKEELTRFLKRAKFYCKKCGRAAAHQVSLCRGA